MKAAREIVLLAHNLRSSHNVGSLLRTADGLSASVFLTGYTPYPVTVHDKRLPHIAQKTTAQIKKTALGAETTAHWDHSENVSEVIEHLKKQGFTIGALEQALNSENLADFTPPQKIAIIVGREIEGIEPEILSQSDVCLEIPMFGKKESFNVVQAAAMALYHCRFFD